MSRRSVRPLHGLPLLAMPLLASCVAPGAVTAPAPPPRIVAPPVPVAEQHDWTEGPLAPGGWTYRAEGTATIAAFGLAGQPPVFTLRCTGGQIVAERAGGSGPLRITTTFGARTLPVPVRFAPSDPMLDQMAFSRGRLMIEGDPRPALVLPAQAEIGRVVEDCRS